MRRNARVRRALGRCRQRLETGIENVGNQAFSQFRVDPSRARFAIDRRKSHADVGERRQRFAVGVLRRWRQQVHVGGAKLALDRADGAEEGIRGCLSSRVLASGDFDREKRQIGRVLGGRLVPFEFAIFEHEESAETLSKRASDCLDDSGSRRGVGCHQVGGVGLGDLACHDGLLCLGDKDAEKGQRSVDVQAPALGKFAPHRLAGLKAGDHLAEPHIIWCPVPGFLMIPGAVIPWRRCALHRRASSVLTRSGTVDATSARNASSTSKSGSPVHSSMKNFLNSMAIAQPVCGKYSWMKRVCSPRP